MQIAIIGGTFDPPHLGHFGMISHSSKQFDKVLVIPNNTPSYKKKNIASSLERFEMCKIMCETAENVEVLDIEIAKKDFMYSVDTLSKLKEQYKNDELLLVLGTDNFLHFEKWYKYEEILRICTLCVFKRNNEDILNHYEYMVQKYNAKIVIINNDVVQISSSELRENINEKMLDAKVVKYIKDKSLYGE